MARNRWSQDRASHTITRERGVSWRRGGGLRTPGPQCHYHRMGTCRYGTKCFYNHSQPKQECPKTTHVTETDDLTREKAGEGDNRAVSVRCLTSWMGEPIPPVVAFVRRPAKWVGTVSPHLVHLPGFSPPCLLCFLGGELVGDAISVCPERFVHLKKVVPNRYANDLGQEYLVKRGGLTRGDPSIPGSARGGGVVSDKPWVSLLPLLPLTSLCVSCIRWGRRHWIF